MEQARRGESNPQPTDLELGWDENALLCRPSQPKLSHVLSLARLAGVARAVTLSRLATTMLNPASAIG